MNTLDKIRTLVAAHTAAKEAAIKGAKLPNYKGSEAAYIYHKIYEPQDAAVQLLASILPTLELMVAWESMENRNLPMDEQGYIYDKLNNAIVALTKDTE